MRLEGFGRKGIWCEAIWCKGSDLSTLDKRAEVNADRLPWCSLSTLRNYLFLRTYCHQLLSQPRPQQRCLYRRPSCSQEDRLRTERMLRVQYWLHTDQVAVRSEVNRQYTENHPKCRIKIESTFCRVSIINEEEEGWCPWCEVGKSGDTSFRQPNLSLFFENLK